MVLVSYILDDYISILQTKLSDREGYEARRVGVEAMPLDQHIEGGHGERCALPERLGSYPLLVKRVQHGLLPSAAGMTAALRVLPGSRTLRQAPCPRRRRRVRCENTDPWVGT